MKKLLIILIFIVTATAMADTFKAKAGESIFVGAEVPAGKIGGGDFYNLNLVPENGDYSSFSYVETDGGMKITFTKSGTYSLNLVVNHITKSSCASVKSQEYSSKSLNIIVSE